MVPMGRQGRQDLGSTSLEFGIDELTMNSPSRTWGKYLQTYPFHGHPNFGYFGLPI
jgi:hypothetical protein